MLPVVNVASWPRLRVCRARRQQLAGVSLKCSAKVELRWPIQDHLARARRHSQRSGSRDAVQAAHGVGRAL
jgi:hypothetical protein